MGEDRDAGLARWARETPLEGQRLSLEPLQVDHAAEMALVLGDTELHRFTGGEPATRAGLVETYMRQVAGPADPTQQWLNWVVRRRADEQPVGTVQATIGRADGKLVAEVAWVIGTAHQGRGYAVEAAQLMVSWIRAQGDVRVIAHVHPDHDASAAVAHSVGLVPSDTVVDGEVRWLGR
jgi:RimJ/RimL family protein N-acetyltransferase